MTVLHLSTIGDTFDDSQEIALGPHCFIDREDVFPNWQNLEFVDAYKNEASLEIAERNVRKLINTLIPRFAEQLNTYHNSHYSNDFWRIIILPWLIEIVQRAWTGYSRLRNLDELHQSRSLAVKIYDGPSEWQIRDTAEVLDLLLRDYNFNWWIDSELARALSPENWQLTPAAPLAPRARPIVSEPRADTKSKIGSLVRKIKYRLGYSDILGIKWSGFLLALYVNILPKRRSNQQHDSTTPNLPEDLFPPRFLKVLDYLIEATIPHSLLEGFSELAAKAIKLPYRAGRLRLGTLSFWNEQEKVIAAFAIEAGEKRVVFQHGGEYGMLNYNLMFNEMEGKSCIFISWGWNYNKSENGHILPLPSPYHSKMADKHRRQTEDIIVIGPAIRINLHRIHWCSRSSVHLWYCKDSINFIDNLSQKVRNAVVYRPYTRTANDIEVRALVSTRFPKIPMLETDLEKALLKCRLVVITSFSTTMNFSMAANVPTIVYMPPEIMAPHSEAEPYFEALRKCGVVHESAVSAAAYINSIEENIEDWWQSKEVQDARKIWVNQFARTDQLWWWHWMKSLAGLKHVG